MTVNEFVMKIIKSDTASTPYGNNIFDKFNIKKAIKK